MRTNVDQKCHSEGLNYEKEPKKIRAFLMLQDYFLPFADGKNFAISNRKNVSYDR